MPRDRMGVGPSRRRGSSVPLDALRPGQVLADLVYHPIETALLRGARDRGADVVDGSACSCTRPRSKLNAGPAGPHRWRSCGRPRDGAGSARIGLNPAPVPRRRPRAQPRRLPGRWTKEIRVDGVDRAARNSGNARTAELLACCRSRARRVLSGSMRRTRPRSSTCRGAVLAASRRAASRSPGFAPAGPGESTSASRSERADDGTFRFGPEEPRGRAHGDRDLEVAIDELAAWWRSGATSRPSSRCSTAGSGSPTSSASKSSRSIASVGS